MNVLIVEDNSSDYRKLEEVLSLDEEQNLPDEEKTYCLFRATSLNEAKTKIADNSAGFFSLGIIDIKLDENDSGNRDGLKAAKTILNSGNRAFPVVMVTNLFDVEEYAVEAEKIGVELKYFLNKRMLRENPHVFLDRINDAVNNFGIRVMTAEEYVAYKDRKIGIKSNLAGEYKFYSRNEILYLTTLEGGRTLFKMTNGDEFERGRNLGYFVPKIRSNFYNFLKLDQSIVVNLELVKSVEGENLHFDNGDFIKLSKAAIKNLRRQNLLF